VACQAFARAQAKPADQSYRLWLYALAREELQRRIEEFQEKESTTVPLDGTELPQPFAGDDEDDTNQSRAVVVGPRQDDEVELKDVTPDTHVPAPDAEAADHDLVQYLHEVPRIGPGKNGPSLSCTFSKALRPTKWPCWKSLRSRISRR